MGVAVRMRKSFIGHPLESTPTPAGGGAGAPRQLTLATHGEPGTDGAGRMAFALVRALDASINVLAVVGRRIARAMHAPSDIGIAVARQMTRLHESLPSNGQIRIEYGIARDVIPLLAAGLGTDLLVLGRPEGAATTTLAVLRRATVPVLCVGREARGAPRHILCMLDDTAASVRAARLGVTLLGQGAATLLCLHTLTADELDPDLDLTVAVRAGLRVPARVVVSLAAWGDGSAGLILEMAAGRHIDVITTGRRVESSVAGRRHASLIARLVADAPIACSVLIAR
jgi:hypothetical protein